MLDHLLLKRILEGKVELWRTLADKGLCCSIRSSGELKLSIVCHLREAVSLKVHLNVLVTHPWKRTQNLVDIAHKSSNIQIHSLRSLADSEIIATKVDLKVLILMCRSSLVECETWHVELRRLLMVGPGTIRLRRLRRLVIRFLFAGI